VHRLVVAVIVAISSISASAAEADLASLHFLLGDWKAVGTPAGETGGFTFRLGVQDNVITRTNYAVYEAQAGQAGSRLAAPGSSEFKDYLSWSARKVR